MFDGAIQPVASVNANTLQPFQAPPLTFGLSFQRSMLRLAMDDEAFCALISKHLEARYFEDSSLGWIFTVIKTYFEHFSHPPSAMVLFEYLKMLPPEQAQHHAPAVNAVCSTPCTDAPFIGERLVEFIKRNLIVEGVHNLRALYNAGKIDEAVRFFGERASAVESVSIGTVDRASFFEGLDERQKRRIADAAAANFNTFSTGIPDLDRILGGGLHKGELGVWIGSAKAGKSTCLRWLTYFAVRALQIPVLYFVLEGGREETENAFDAAFAAASSQDVRRGQMDPTVLSAMRDEYRALRNLLWIRGFTKDDGTWNATVADFQNELKELRIRHGFRPKMIVVDYGDLMRSREKGADNERDHQKAAFRDLKTLTGRDDGYAIWTASQAQRGGKGSDVNEKAVLKSYQIADAYDKVRVADFIGSINRTVQEAESERARIYAELYRHAPAGRLIEINTNYRQGRFYTSVARSTPLALAESAGEQQLLDDALGM